ncbi:MAG: hypothetical protein JWQ49_4216 [Edaphobacter sp.]|nr:hypothetical protein [Edaphobacter sp.]
MGSIAIQRNRTVSIWGKMFAICWNALLKSAFWIHSVSSGEIQRRIHTVKNNND